MPTDISWRVFHILTEPVPYAFVSVNVGGPRIRYSVDLRTQTYTEPVPLKYSWVYGYFYSIRFRLQPPDLAAGTVCAIVRVRSSVRLFPLYLLNRMTFDLDMLHKYWSMLQLSGFEI